MRLRTIVFGLLGLSGLQAAANTTSYFENDHGLADEIDEDILSLSSYRQLALYSPKAEFSNAETQAALNMINAERKYVAQKLGGTDLIFLTENKNLTKLLQRFVAIGGADWGYEEANVTHPPGFNHVTNFWVLKQNATFMRMAQDYAGLPELLRNSDLVPAHDTYKPKPGRALQIVRLRVNQRDCLNYTKCKNNPPLTFKNFQPCSVYPNIDKLPEKCLWFYWYYARFVHARASQFAMVKLHRPGRFVVNHAQTEAWLLLFVFDGIQMPEAPMALQTDNLPYHTNRSCPVKFPKRRADKLCEAVPTAAPTAVPTATPTQDPTTTPTIDTVTPTKTPTKRLRVG